VWDGDKTHNNHKESKKKEQGYNKALFLKEDTNQ
jgi:hypothetical protein